MQVLARVWRCDEETALNFVETMAAPGIVRFATLQNGAVWCVVNGPHSLALKYVFKAEAKAIHEEVLAAYERRRSFQGWGHLHDDGFIMLHVVAFLGEVGRLDEMRCAPLFFVVPAAESPCHRSCDTAPLPPVALRLRSKII